MLSKIFTTHNTTRNRTIIMATFPGLKTIDPIQGLVDYVSDIKPYHSKIFEVLVEYVYTDMVNVTVVDKMNMSVDEAASDTANVSITEASITEMFDFFITAPIPFTANVSASGSTILFAGNVINQVPVGALVYIPGSTGNFDVVGSVYDPGTLQTIVTLNTPATSGVATVYNIDTTYTFNFPVVSFNPGPVSITEPVTNTTFLVATFTVAGNASLAVQPGSVFKVQETGNEYYTEFVQFVPAFAVDGAREPTLDTTIIGVGVGIAAFPSVVSAGTLIPYRTTGYDNPYDGPYDRMAGYRIIYPAP
jgi:hypothetical protein